MILYPSLTAWLINLDCRTVNQRSRTSLITNFTSSGMWASASLASWWVKCWKGTFLGGKGVMTHVCCCLRMSSPLCRSSGWSSAWCSVVPSATAERSSRLEPWRQIVYLANFHPGTRKVTIIRKFLPVTSSSCLNFHSSEFFLSSQHSVMTYTIQGRQFDFWHQCDNLPHIYDFFFMAIWKPLQILTHTPSE